MGPCGIFIKPRRDFFQDTQDSMRLPKVKVLLGLFTCFGKNEKQATKCNPTFNTGKSSAGTLTG